MLRAMQNSENNALQVYLRGRLFLLFYRATARQRGNSFPSCAWRNIVFRTRFSWFDHIFTTNSWKIQECLCILAARCASCNAWHTSSAHLCNPAGGYIRWGIDSHHWYWFVARHLQRWESFHIWYIRLIFLPHFTTTTYGLHHSRYGFRQVHLSLSWDSHFCKWWVITNLSQWEFNLRLR